jgi:hypothetical protein
MLPPAHQCLATQSCALCTLRRHARGTDCHYGPSITEQKDQKTWLKTPGLTERSRFAVGIRQSGQVKEDKSCYWPSAHLSSAKAIFW